MSKKKRTDDIDAVCHYCEEAAPLRDKEFMLCERYGVVSSFHKCRHFSYDPLKRVPPPPKAIDKDDDTSPAILEGL